MESKNEFLMMWLLRFFFISYLLKPMPLVDGFAENSIILQ